MKKLFFIPAVFFFLSNNLFSQSNLQSLIQSGVAKAYNMEFDEAEKIFNRVIENYPNQPHGYYRTAQIHFWIFLGTRDPGEYYVFLKFADLAQQKIDKILLEHENNYRMTYMAGNLASFKAMAYATNNSTVDAIWASKKAVDYFDKTRELNSKFYDVYLGLGIFDYAMSFVPDFLKWAVSLTGLTSDRERGLHFIKTAYYKGNDKTEAAFHLAKIYTDYLADYDSAYIYLNSLINQFPRNTLFQYQYAVTLIKDRQLDRANEFLNKVVRLNNTKLPQITALAHYRKGEILFKKNRFKDAVTEYDIFLETTKEIDFAGIAAYNIALCYKFLGNDNEYEKYLVLAKLGNQDVFEDSYAKSKSEEYSSKEITKEDLMLVRMHNNLEAGKYRIVFDSLKNVVTSLHGTEQKALALSYLCEASLRLKNYDEVDNAFEQIKNLHPPKERWVIPNAYLNMAWANFYLGKKAAASDFIEDAESNNDYDFKDQLQAKIENLKRKLKAGKH